MAKEQVIITKPSGITAVGTISKISKKSSGNRVKTHDENGNVDGYAYNQKLHVMDAEVELTSTARGSIPNLGDTIAATFGDDDGSENYVCTEVTIQEQNSGEPNTVSVTAEYDVPSA